MRPGKTPYEIRLDLLRLAFDIKHHEALTKSALADIERGDGKQMVTHFATVEDVIDHADQMNKFVSHTTDNN